MLFENCCNRDFTQLGVPQQVIVRDAFSTNLLKPKSHTFTLHISSTSKFRLLRSFSINLEVKWKNNSMNNWWLGIMKIETSSCSIRKHSGSNFSWLIETQRTNALRTGLEE